MLSSWEKNPQVKPSTCGGHGGFSDFFFFKLFIFIFGLVLFTTARSGC